VKGRAIAASMGIHPETAIFAARRAERRAAKIA